MEPVAILSKKRKLIPLLLISVAICLGAARLLHRVSHLEGIIFTVAWLIAIMCIIGFCAITTFYLFKLLDPRPGAIINAHGIRLMGIVGYHPLIPWEHITHCSNSRILQTRLLLVYVDNVDEALARMPTIGRLVQQLTVATAGTPHILSSAALQGNFDDLKNLIEGGIAAYAERNA